MRPTASEISVCEVSGIMRDDLWPEAIGSRKVRLREASRVLSRGPYRWSLRRVRALFDGEARRVDAHEMDELRALKRGREIEEMRHDFWQLRSRISTQ